jgi:hypothetical protein
MMYLFYKTMFRISVHSLDLRSRFWFSVLNMWRNTMYVFRSKYKALNTLVLLGPPSWIFHCDFPTKQFWLQFKEWISYILFISLSKKHSFMSFWSSSNYGPFRSLSDIKKECSTTKCLSNSQERSYNILMLAFIAWACSMVLVNTVVLAFNWLLICCVPATSFYTLLRC